VLGNCEVIPNAPGLVVEIPIAVSIEL